MRELLLIAGATAAAMAVVAGAVGPGHDTTILVSPPEAVAEQFSRKLARGQYELAADNLEPQGDPATRVDALKRWGNQLHERAGAIEQLEGKPGTIAGNAATASAILTTAHAGRIELSFTMVRRAGAWQIREWNDGNLPAR